MNSRELRNARVFKSAQAHYDNMDPPEYDEDEDWAPRTKAPVWVPWIKRDVWMLGYTHPNDEPEDWEVNSRDQYGQAFRDGQSQRKEDESC